MQSGSTVIEPVIKLTTDTTMQKKEKSELSNAFVLAVASPILLINLIVPIMGDQQHAILETLLSGYLIENIGFWSSRFPLSSKITTNYIAIFGPIFGAVLFLKSYKNAFQSIDRFNQTPLYKYLFMTLTTILICSLFVYEAYFNSTDLITQGPKLRIMGLNFLFYSMFSFTVIFFILLLPALVIHLLIYTPYRLIKLLKPKQHP
ncbi:hypothetical protein DBV33_15855 [Pseudomonas fluorescens]|nr:hypothetical protein DBV33_15855 [Pseudomonas fluorescens]